MRTLMSALVIAAVTANAARAEICDPQQLWHRAETLVQRLIGAAPRSDRGLITPPPDIDPKMALVPPSGGRLRVIPPPDPRGR